MDCLFNFWRKPSVCLEDFIRAAQRCRGEGDDHFFLNGTDIVVKRKDTEKTEQLNLRTWEAFEKALRYAFSPSRFENTVNRYKLNFEDAKARKFPLERHHVECAGIAASCPYEFQYQEVLGHPYINKESIKTLQRVNAEVTRYGYLGNHPPYPEIVTGGPQEISEYLFQSPQIIDQRRSLLYEGMEYLVAHDPNIGRLHPYYSRLTMGIISLLETNTGNEDKKLIIPAPGAREGEVDYYTVFDIISKGGLTAVALTPLSDESTLSPVISFRCTKQSFAQADAVESMLNDIEENIGESGYKKSQEALDDLMKNPAFLRGKKPIVTAYSLGGAHAGYFMRDHWKDISECICFNWVGNVDNPQNQVANPVEEFARQVNALPENEAPPPLYFYRNKGDHANFVGKKHLGWGIDHPKALVQVMEYEINDYPIPDEENIFSPTEIMKWLNVHAVRPLDSKRNYKYHIYRGKECNALLDTYARNHSIEDKRNKWGVQFLHTAISAIYQTVDFILRLFGIEYFRKN